MRRVNRYGIRVGEMKLYVGLRGKGRMPYIRFVNVEWIKKFLLRENITEQDILDYFNLDNNILRGDNRPFFDTINVGKGICFREQVSSKAFNLDALADVKSHTHSMESRYQCDSNVGLKNIQAFDNMFLKVGKAFEHIHNSISKEIGDGTMATLQLLRLKSGERMR